MSNIVVKKSSTKCVLVQRYVYVNLMGTFMGTLATNLIFSILDRDFKGVAFSILFLEIEILMQEIF